jgi:hypothetical protein
MRVVGCCPVPKPNRGRANGDGFAFIHVFPRRRDQKTPNTKRRKVLFQPASQSCGGSGAMSIVRADSTGARLRAMFFVIVVVLRAGK